MNTEIRNLNNSRLTANLMLLGFQHFHQLRTRYHFGSLKIEFPASQKKIVGKAIAKTLSQQNQEPKVISVHCDCCDETAQSTRENLIRRGWTFSNGSEFCPEHNY